MPSVIYDVALSIDGFISGAAGDVSLFPHQGPVVDDYLERLSSYRYCLMGRRTYEFGYQFGLAPGDNPYPSMTSVVFSTTLQLPAESQVEVVPQDPLTALSAIREASPGDIYLCGGGELAGYLATNRAIDVLRIKRAPMLLGSGTRLFGNYSQVVPMKHIQTTTYDGGILFQEFELE